MMKMPGMMSCREVHRVVATDAAPSLGRWDRLRLRLHVLMCHHCARYLRQLAALARHARRTLGQEPDPEHCRRLAAAIMAAWHDGSKGR
jgi:hypothetical protein